MEQISQLFSKLYDKVAINYQNSPTRSQLFPELSANDEYYLDILYSQSETTATQFADQAGISKPAATRIVKRFVAAGYLVKKPSKHDKRVIFLTLSPEMSQHCQQNYRLFDQVFLDAISILDESEQQQLQQLMLKVDRNL
ncbi:MarR family transcriptional regulator [Leuconostoc falkenbergense]|jgi:DNA-binding MarR family transcriptional regulator|uniref:Helix-turn-helix domain-containing protein n=1 Tax=Leuconostoc falkenbergense TaxID=2766470 RepID=A0A9X3IQ07_9LACO|nr:MULTISPECIES: helix-turn-helix domain-containing protein [Leuconostoc]VTU64075.1 MarR family transcriptional regulator [Lactobacillus pentosus] [Leuconostoc pseudomesenteroides]MCT4378563.1 MarR family transcriptional regulator [Leuconostoc falkenbergense]MCT4390132.1 MarR family transcriptional regulator [Leuconostoc falkenbergense]MCT4403414.1 MarR family transcriptional regulator [Leuconostoc falkenbergense]MCT4411391.1 MarR family transcriptional regulator [Leuconostoc falkenbergense]